MKLAIFFATVAAAGAAWAQAGAPSAGPPTASPSAASAPPASGPAPVTKPRWIQLPTNQELAWFYPPQALIEAHSGLTAIKGAAGVACTVTAQGGLADCAVKQEKPRGYGFGAAALKVTRYFHMQPVDQDGQPVAGRPCNVVIFFSVNG